MKTPELKPKRDGRVRSSELVRRRASLANVKRTLNAIDFDAMFRRIRDNLNAKAGWDVWT